MLLLASTMEAAGHGCVEMQKKKTDEFESVVLEGKVLVDSIKSVSLIEKKRLYLLSFFPFF